jgi:diguanylate cyclase (GGDEF)-like protein/PAS domain S-box-containing protein
MLIKLASLLVVVGVLMLVVGIFIARQYTLRAKLLTAFLVIVLGSMGVLTFLSSTIMGESLSDSANQMLASAGRQYADRLDEFNRNNMKSVEAESRLPAIVNFLSRKLEPYNRQTMLEIMVALKSKQNARITSYGVLNADGINVLDTEMDNVGKDESDSIYYKEAVKSGRAYMSPIVFADENDPSFYFSSAITDLSGRLLGVLRARYQADELNKIITSARGLAGRGSFAILLNENMLRLVHGRRLDLRYTMAGRIDSKTMEELINAQYLPAEVSVSAIENLQWNNAVKKAMQYSKQQHVAAQFFGLGTDIYSAVVIQLDTAPWVLVFAQSQESVFNPVERQIQSSLALAALVALIVILIMLGATQFLLGPVRRLTSIVEKIGKGHLDIVANVEADDEVGHLAKAFNSMSQNVNGLIVDLEREVDLHKLTADNLRKLSQAIEQSPVSVMITDLDGNIEYVNPEFIRVTGYDVDDVIGENPRIISSGETPSYQYKNMWHAITSGRSWSGELYNKKKNGELFWENVTISPIKNEEGESTHYLAIKEDITLRKDYEERLLYQASYDKLTDLPNRSLAYDRLQQAIANAIREKRHIAVIYIDFDHFKNINDTLGHAAGDKFLVMMASRIQDCVRDVDTVARLGGDEFLIMLAEIGSERHETDAEYEKSIREKIEYLLKEVSRPCMIEEMEFSVTVSAGVALFPKDGEDPHVLLRNADTAMYRSKRKGRDTYEMFSPEMSDTIFRRVEIDSKLRRALEEEKLTLKYQALMDTETHEIVGAEALIRWEDEELGEISPDVFVPLAEESGLIVEIGEWVIDQACAGIKQLQIENPGRELYIAINLSGRQFRGRGIVGMVSDILQKHNLSGDSLELEITERLLMKDVPEVIVTLNQFKQMDIRLSIDDFGTGYSSLSYLKRFPFDVLKIDQAFVRDIGVDQDDTALCEAIIAMAHSLGLSIIAEGVETKDQYEFLSQRGTETIQGYYISRPVDLDGFRQLLGQKVLID